jgi:hypothetical protein
MITLRDNNGPHGLVFQKYYFKGGDPCTPVLKNRILLFPTGNVIVQIPNHAIHAIVCMPFAYSAGGIAPVPEPYLACGVTHLAVR